MRDNFNAALEQCDVAMVRKMWKHISPNMPQPKSDDDALVAIHYARTLMPSVAFKLRAYSHAWLMDHNFPSGLPDRLRPRAQRIYPITVSAVGISVKGSTEIGRKIAPIVERAMSDAVLEAYGDGMTDPSFVKDRMMEAQAKARRHFCDLIASSSK